MTLSADLIVFAVLALIAVASAVGMLTSRSAIYAALFLVLNFMTVAILYLILGAPFIALAQVTVYAGAIMVLFLFVIMLLGTEVLPPSQVLPWQRPVAIGLAVLLFLEAGFWLITRGPVAEALAAPSVAMNDATVIRQISEVLFNQYLLPFEVTSILLLVAMVGTIILTHAQRSKRGGV
jgi:NADH-quinone oxidoreductase subunit J